MRCIRDCLRDFVDLQEGKSESVIEARMVSAFKEFGVEVQQQVWVGKRRLDIVIEKLNIECDGKEYHDKEQDAIRDKEIESYGFKVIRIPGRAIRRNPKAIAAYIIRGCFPELWKEEMLQLLPTEIDYKLYVNAPRGRMYVNRTLIVNDKV